MKNSTRKHLVLPLVLILSLPHLVSCSPPSSRQNSSLDRIRKRGRIIMITQKSESTYYIYRGRPQGFEYELAAEFADFIGVDLEVVTPGWMEMFAMLEQGRGDFLAAGVAALPAREKRMHFSDPYLTVRQEVIVRHDRSEIKTERDLDGKTVHVRAGTSFQETLAGLLGEGVRMELVLAPDVSSDELIRQVADGEIDATVTYSNVALGNRIYYPEVKTAFPISRPLIGRVV